MILRATAIKLALVMAAVPHPHAAAKTQKPKRPKWRTALASVYGTGRQGDTSTGTMACGPQLTPSLVAVANKTMPCGSKLTLGYRRFTVRVRVLDRGPYSGARVFDLTSGAASLIHFPVAVGVVKWRHGWHRR